MSPLKFSALHFNNTQLWLSVKTEELETPGHVGFNTRSTSYYFLVLLDRSRKDTRIMKYRRIFPVESLSKVENPWKGVTLNRCITVAIIIVAVSSGVEKIQEVLEPYFEETEDSGSELQAGDLSDEGSWWDTFAFWNWGSEDKMEDFKKKRAAKQRLPGEKVGPRRIRNKETDKGLLKERE